MRKETTENSQSRSVLGRVLPELGRRTRDAWRALPGGTLPRLLGGLAVSFVVAAGLCYALTLLGRRLARDHGLADWDRRALLWSRDHLPLSFTDAIIFESPGNLSSLVPLTLIATAVALWHRRLVVALAFPLAYVLARPLIWLGWEVWDRARPDLIEGGVAALPAHSFPSGHVVQVVTMHGLLVWLWLRRSRSPLEHALGWLLLLTLATLVAAARIRMGAHWPSDCLAGLLVGTAWLIGIALSIRFAEALAPPNSSSTPAA